MEIGDKIRRLRVAKQLTQEELANRCELSKGFISQLENDLTSPSIATLIVKAIFGEGTPLKGGMPSGHSAIGFSIATIIAIVTEEPTVIILSYLMASLLAQSRVDSKVHSIIEVIAGAIFGILLTLLIFRIFY